MNDALPQILDDAERILIEAVLEKPGNDVPNDQQKLDWSSFEFQQLPQKRRETRDPLECRLLTRQIRKYVRHKLRYLKSLKMSKILNEFTDLMMYDGFRLAIVAQSVKHKSNLKRSTIFLQILSNQTQYSITVLLTTSWRRYGSNHVIQFFPSPCQN